MSKVRFYFRIYLKILSQDIKSRMSYRSDFIISMIGMIFTNAAELAAFYIMFQNFNSVCGWTYYEMLFLYGFSLVALTPMQCLFENNWNLSGYVRRGDFIKYCFRPVNVFFYYISEIFDVKGLGQLAMGIGTLVYSWIKLELPVTPLLLLELLVALASASLFFIGIMNFAAAVCFYLINTGFLIGTVSKFRDYAKYPVTIFNKGFRFLFTFIIPIAFIAYYPSLVIMRPTEIPLLTWLAPAFGVLFFYASYKFWMYGASKYSGTGS
ncbi:MAG: ABC-2 family transporter protein [Lachnospiraceae bacterium]|nr:ABC-2 family transporter protein [Lachnospiraceae bacterium]